MASILNKTFFLLYFYISTTNYLKFGALRFTNITDADTSLDSKLSQKVVKNNYSQVVVTDFKEEMVKKKNKYTLEKNAQIKIFCHLVFSHARSLKLLFAKSPTFLLLHCLPAIVVFYARFLKMPCSRSISFLSLCLIPSLIIFCTISLELLCTKFFAFLLLILYLL